MCRVLLGRIALVQVMVLGLMPQSGAPLAAMAASESTIMTAKEFALQGTAVRWAQRSMPGSSAKRAATARKALALLVLLCLTHTTARSPHQLHLGTAG